MCKKLCAANLAKGSAEIQRKNFFVYRRAENGLKTQSLWKAENALLFRLWSASLHRAIWLHALYGQWGSQREK